MRAHNHIHGRGLFREPLVDVGELSIDVLGQVGNFDNHARRVNRERCANVWCAINSI